MATSSFSKSFVINSKTEASNLVKMFADSLSAPTTPVKAVKTSAISAEQMKRVINAKLHNAN